MTSTHSTAPGLDVLITATAIKAVRNPHSPRVLESYDANCVAREDDPSVHSTSLIMCIPGSGSGGRASPPHPLGWSSSCAAASDGQFISLVNPSTHCKTIALLLRLDRMVSCPSLRSRLLFGHTSKARMVLCDSKLAMHVKLDTTG